MRDDDSFSVPLPHGTDVVTRLEREQQGGRVAAGTPGRVVAVDGDAVDVHIVNVGVVRYARSELTPFRAGQVRYAVARDAAWSALHRNVVLEAVVGSRAWGLADEGSTLEMLSSRRPPSSTQTKDAIAKGTR